MIKSGWAEGVALLVEYLLRVPEAMDILHILDVVARAFNPSTREIEARGVL